jgi:hypothetical protein
MMFLLLARLPDQLEPAPTCLIRATGCGLPLQQPMVAIDRDYNL